jgi:hypothetical protein
MDPTTHKGTTVQNHLLSPYARRAIRFFARPHSLQNVQGAAGAL